MRRAATSPPAIARPSIVVGESDSRLDAGLQRPLLAAARVLARAVRRRSRRSPTAASTSCRSTTSPTRSCTCSTARERGRRSTSSPAARRRTVAELVDMAAERVRRARARARRARRRRAPLADRRRSTCRTSTCASSSTTRAPASVLGPPGIRAPRLARLLRRADRLRGGRPLGQAPDEPAGRPRADGARRGLGSGGRGPRRSRRPRARAPPQRRPPGSVARELGQGLSGGGAAPPR